MGLLRGQIVNFRDANGDDMIAVIAADHGNLTYSVIALGDPNYLYGPLVAPFAYSLDPTPVPIGTGNYSVQVL